MRDVITVDTWLMELADRGRQYTQPALQLGLCQYGVSKHTGHLLALNDAFVRRKLTQAAKEGNIPLIRVRCMRCYTVATLRDWISCSAMSDELRFSYWEKIRQKNGEIQAAFLHACPGEAQAEAHLEVLRALEERAHT